MSARPIKVMVLCTGNSCRSQMAEGFLRELSGGLIEAHSAGSRPSHVHPLAVRVMAESGIDISSQRSKPIEPALLASMDYVITVCDNARAACPVTPPTVKRIHMPIEDPALTKGSEGQVLDVFRRVRDTIRDEAERLIEKLKKDGAEGLALPAPDMFGIKL